ncbi:hypothetical protein B0T24DRAFT_693460 [Lasiosphaeria ovina]|uniref:Uncharacterized protein n=1 Tax=Lasiosphaeria ovina TaxID=92902 RepID=A0AAE0JSD1_9PEZI|nr:hypothetical protein B0T24DRAFT_693460 [Lasiosphaeria ovina]
MAGRPPLKRPLRVGSNASFGSNAPTLIEDEKENPGLGKKFTAVSLDGNPLLPLFSSLQEEGFSWIDFQRPRKFYTRDMTDEITMQKMSDEDLLSRWQNTFRKAVVDAHILHRAGDHRMRWLLALRINGLYITIEPKPTSTPATRFVPEGGGWVKVQFVVTLEPEDLLLPENINQYDCVKTLSIYRHRTYVSVEDFFKTLVDNGSFRYQCAPGPNQDCRRWLRDQVRLLLDCERPLFRSKSDVDLVEDILLGWTSNKTQLNPDNNIPFSEGLYLDRPVSAMAKTTKSWLAKWACCCL